MMYMFQLMQATEPVQILNLVHVGADVLLLRCLHM